MQWNLQYSINQSSIVFVNCKKEPHSKVISIILNNIRLNPSASQKSTKHSSKRKSNTVKYSKQSSDEEPTNIVNEEANETPTKTSEEIEREKQLRVEDETHKTIATYM